MDRLGGDRSEPAEAKPEERLLHVGARMAELLKQVIAAIVILGVFVGLAFLVLEGQLQDDALILYAGVILGYLLYSVKGLV